MIVYTPHRASNQRNRITARALGRLLCQLQIERTLARERRSHAIGRKRAQWLNRTERAGRQR
jgi:hypothetical protein